MAETPSSSPISTKLQRIATLAQELQGCTLTTLAHHIDVPFLREAYRRTRKDGAVGVDGQTAEAYAEHLDENLTTLLHHFKAGTTTPRPCGGPIFPKPVAPSVARSGCPPLRIRSSNEPWRWCWWPCMSKSFWTARMGFAPSGRPIRPWKRSDAR